MSRPGVATIRGSPLGKEGKCESQDVSEGCVHESAGGRYHQVKSPGERREL